MKKVGETPPVSQVAQNDCPAAKLEKRPRDTISSISNGKSLLKDKVFFEDLSQFFLNIFLWPFHGIILFRYQVLFVLLFPILLPLLLVTELIRELINLIVCGCWDTFDLGPKFKLRDPTDGQLSVLEPIVERSAYTNLPIKEQARLLYILDNYLDFISKYNDSEVGKKHLQVNGLIKFQVDGKAKLFHYLPNEGKANIYKKYIEFIGESATLDSEFKFTFASLDYAYLFGMIDLRIQTDIIEYQIEKLQTEEKKPQPSFFQSFTQRYAPTILSTYFRPTIGRRYSTKATENKDFAFWPGNTRAFCCNRINAELKAHDLEDYQISLAEVESLIRLES